MTRASVVQFAAAGFAARLGGDALDFAPDAQQVAAPELRDVGPRVTARLELGRHVARLGRVLPADDPAAAAEVGADADVVDADQLHRVVDVVDEVAHRRAGPALADRALAVVPARALLGCQRAEAAALGQADAVPQLAERRDFLVGPRLQVLVVRHHLDHAAVVAQRAQRLVVHVARMHEHAADARSATRSRARAIGASRRAPSSSSRATRRP